MKYIANVDDETYGLIQIWEMKATPEGKTDEKINIIKEIITTKKREKAEIGHTQGHTL